MPPPEPAAPPSSGQLHDAHRTRRRIDPAAFSELDYLLESGSDRIGFLDFQSSPSKYVPRGDGGSPLEELQEASVRIEAGVPLSGGLAEALLHDSSIGGARPKATITDGDRKWIAKFSSTGDTYNVVKGEFIAMRLASLIGLDVAPVRLVRVHGRDVLLVERFDRHRSDGGWTRRGLASALTLLELDEMMARYASYEALAEKIRAGFAEPRTALRELFLRLVVNVLAGNTDDHARNHAALWNGREYRLAPAYDVCPQARTGGEATQAMLIVGEDRRSRIATCLAAAGNFLLPPDEALTLVEGALETVIDRWNDVCDEAALGEVDRRFFWRRQFLNPYAFEELDGRAAALRARV